MDLEAALKKTTPARSTCRIKNLLESLDEKNSKALEAACNSELSPYAITRALRSEGLVLSENSVYKHRRNECKCVTK
jgi:CMP-N-acetylneuraminic acid synthetase